MLRDKKSFFCQIKYHEPLNHMVVLIVEFKSDLGTRHHFIGTQRLRCADYSLSSWDFHSQITISMQITRNLFYKRQSIRDELAN